MTPCKHVLCFCAEATAFQAKGPKFSAHFTWAADSASSSQQQGQFLASIQHQIPCQATVRLQGDTAMELMGVCNPINQTAQFAWNGRIITQDYFDAKALTVSLREVRPAQSPPPPPCKSLCTACRKDDRPSLQSMPCWNSPNWKRPGRVHGIGAQKCRTNSEGC